MELLDKLKILSDAAKYDVSCSSSGSNRSNKNNGIGNGHMSGICHSWSDDGRCISLLKILMTNYCVYDCLYCINRSSNDIPRATFTPQEIVDLTINFYRRNYIEGLFLSAAVYKSPNHTMDLLTQTVKKLREEENFNGYIHLKAIPGADERLIELAGKYVDRMSVNIELPSSAGLKLLAPQKKKEAIIRPMQMITSKLHEKVEEKKKYRNTPKFIPAGQTTQMIIGATPDYDLNILRLSEALYQRYQLKRVYYSAYIPTVEHPSLPAISGPPLLREHRLYQADWLLRFYGFEAKELLDEGNPNFDIALDPKCDWALRNLHLFPVEVNRADYEMLLRIPGVGVRSALRIVSARRFAPLTYESLKKIGVVLKRARYFITCKGKYYGEGSINEDRIRYRLTLGDPVKKGMMEGEQISMFSMFPQLTAPKENMDTFIGGLS